MGDVIEQQSGTKSGETFTKKCAHNLEVGDVSENSQNGAYYVENICDYLDPHYGIRLLNKKHLVIRSAENVHGNRSSYNQVPGHTYIYIF